MELWIRSQNKTRLVKVCSLGYGEYKEKHYINGYCVNEVDNYDLGIYKSKERALEVLDDIESLLWGNSRIKGLVKSIGIRSENTKLLIYEMPKE